MHYLLKAKIEPVSHPTPVKSSGPSWADVLEQEVQQAEAPACSSLLQLPAHPKVPKVSGQEAAATAAKEAEKRREDSPSPASAP